MSDTRARLTLNLLTGNADRAKRSRHELCSPGFRSQWREHPQGARFCTDRPAVRLRYCWRAVQRRSAEPVSCAAGSRSSVGDWVDACDQQRGVDLRVDLWCRVLCAESDDTRKGASGQHRTVHYELARGRQHCLEELISDTSLRDTVRWRASLLQQ